KLAPPAPMAVLDRLVGDWHNESVGNTLGNPAGDKVVTQLKSRKILGGRMIASEETQPSGQNDSYWIATYDAAMKAYRLWFWNAQGMVIELVGNENAMQQIRWKGEAP